MADIENGEVGGFDNKKAKTLSLGDGTWICPVFSFLCTNGSGSSLGEQAVKLSDDKTAVVARSQDPLLVLCDGVMMIVLDKLDMRSIAMACSVNSEWLTVASCDQLWASKCMKLWLGKAHIPRISKVEGLSKMKATSLSIIDGKRNRITREDLCDHAWEFHFSETAPEYCRSLDPYWGAAGLPMRRYFHPDGTITAGPDDKIWGEHESFFMIFTSLTADGKMKEHYVRINTWPQMSVVRKSDWSWVLSNCIGCYTSIPDANDDDKVEGTGPSSLII